MDHGLPLPPESVLNLEGYRLVNEKQTDEAIALFELVRLAFPKSANALDSLGDAYVAAGQADRAAKLAELTLVAIPDDPNLSPELAEQLTQAAQAKLAPSAK